MGKPRDVAGMMYIRIWECKRIVGGEGAERGSIVVLLGEFCLEGFLGMKMW